MRNCLTLLIACTFAMACDHRPESLSPSPAAETNAAPFTDLPHPLPMSTSPGLTETDLRTRIRILADDAFQGRAPGTEIGERTADWVAAELERIGVTPAGSHDDWYQTVSMTEQTLDPVASEFRISTGPMLEGEPLSLGEDLVMWTKQQGSSELQLTESELVFVGYGIVAPEYDWDDYAGLDVTGKTVVMLVNDPGYARGDNLFKGRAMTYYGRWTYKYEEATRQGAAGALIIHETAPAAYGWNVVENSWSGPQASLVLEDEGSHRPIVEGWLSYNAAEELFATAGLDLERLKEAAARPGFRPVDMGELTASANLVQDIAIKSSRNVLGQLIGSQRPDEYVLVTAHWDHLGKKTAQRTGGRTEDFYRDQIYNGAVDNATGTSALLEIAEALAATPLERSVLFLAPTLEESGLLGSAYYAEHPTIPLTSIVAGLNIDGLIPLGPTHDMVVVGYGSSELEEILEDILSQKGRHIVPDQKPEAGYFYRSDHISLAKKGVPMLYPDNGVDARDGGVAAGDAATLAYRAQAYHKPMDEYDDDWDLSGMIEDISAMHDVVRHLAMTDAWPTWYPGNEFEAVRQNSLADARR